jgi:hypothetical protein
MKRILKEPLLHFLLLGAALFVAYNFLSKRDTAEPGRIVVTQGRIENLAITFSRAWKRPPTEKELAGLVQDYIREEVYYREALAMGLDRDDTIIRRRLRQKLEFVTDDIAALAEPTDAELTAYLKAHPDAFRVERRFTFSQVYLNPDKRGENLARDTAQLLIQLRQSRRDADHSALGDSFLLERKFEAVPGTEVAKQFGERFVAKLGDLPAGHWHGPVESGYGVHLVFVEERTEGRVPELAEVREVVRREWANARRLESNEKYFRGLLKRYTVTVEKLESAEGEKKLAEVRR